MPVSEVI